MPLPQLTREKLAEVFRQPETMRAFELLLRSLETAPEDVADALAAAAAAQTTANAGVAAAAAAQSDADTAQGEIDAHEALTTAHGVTGDIVGTQGTQTLQGKTLDGATPLTGRTVGTGTAAPVLTANKPGATTAIQTWLTVTINGTNYIIPLYSPS